MRKLFLIISILIQIGLFAQTSDSSKLINKFYLDKAEINLIKEQISVRDTNIDLNLKKIGFVLGKRGEYFMDKYDFFKSSYYSQKHEKRWLFLMKLSERDKKECGGFDYLIITSFKIFTNDDRQKLMNKIKTAS